MKRAWEANSCDGSGAWHVPGSGPDPASRDRDPVPVGAAPLTGRTAAGGFPSFLRRTPRLSVVPAIVALLLSLGAHGALAPAQGLELLGSRLIRDGDFYEHGFGVHGAWLKEHQNGGRLLLLFENRSERSIAIEDLSLNGVPFGQLTDVAVLGGDIPALNWWYAAPAEAAPGDIIGLRLRLLDLDDLGEGPVTVGLQTSVGAFELAFEPQGSPLWIPFVGFLPGADGDLGQAIVYVGNAGNEVLTLPADGGVRVDGRPVPGNPPLTRLEPGAVIPVQIDLPRPRAPGSWVALEARVQEGVRAVGSLRAFPADFGVSFWQVGQQPQWTDPSFQRYAIDLDTPGASVFQDEPSGGRIAPMRLSERIQASWRDDPERPVMLQLTGYEETLVYADLGDITMTHHRIVDQDLSLFLSWPKPVWYLPQNAWGRVESVVGEEAWPPLEDLQHQAFEAIAHGAKHLQWFTYWNLWQQGHGRGGAIDATRSHPDLFLFGAVGNPTLLERVGRLSATISLLRRQLAVSAPYRGYTTAEGVEVTTLISGLDRALVVLVDHRTPLAFYTQKEPMWQPHFPLDQRLEIDVPSHVRADGAFLVDPLGGVRELSLERLEGDRMALEVPVVGPAALVLLAPVEEGRALQEAWQRLELPDSENALQTALAASRTLAEGPWLFTESRYRLPVVLRNDGTEPASLVAFDVPWPRWLDLAPDSLHVVDEGGVPLPFAAEVARSYAALDASGGDRLRAGGDPSFAGLFAAEETGEGFVSSYRSHPSERYTFSLQLDRDAVRETWVEADYTMLTIEARGLEATRDARAQRLVLQFDPDGDGKADGNATLFLVGEPYVDLGDGWRRYIVDVEEAFQELRGADEPFRGNWRPWFQTEVFPSVDAEPSSWVVRNLVVTRNTRVVVPLAEPLLPGAERHLRIYFDERGNGPFTASPQRLSIPDDAADFVRDVTAATGALEVAGAAVSVDGDRLTVRTQASERAVVVEHVAGGGELLQQTLLRPERDGLLPTLALTRPPGSRDLIVTTVVQPGGRGHVFSHHFADAAPAAAGVIETLSLPLGSSSRAEVVDLDVGPGGRLVALAERIAGTAEDGSLQWGRVRLLDDRGRVLWMLSAWEDGGRLGPVFALRFGADGRRLYLAAQRDPLAHQDYDATYLFAFDLDPVPGGAPRLVWRHLAGDGFERSGRAIHQLDAAPDGGVVYADWNGRVARLTPRGEVLWSVSAGGYQQGLAATADGGAFALGAVVAKRISPEGEIAFEVRRSDGSLTRALTATTSGGVFAIADNDVRSFLGTDATPLGVARVGINLRVLRSFVTEDRQVFLAAGSGDGIFQLLIAAGKMLWQAALPGAMVSDIRFTSTGPVVIWEEFDYSPLRLWRFREVVQAFAFSGEVLWRYEGSWRNRPAVVHAVPVAGGGVVVATGEVIRMLAPATAGAE